MEKHPNVIVVFSDQHRAQAMGYAGDRNVYTPQFDKLAAQALSFPFAASVVPVCTPARASLLTGQYPLSHGLFINDVHLRNRSPSVAQAFNAAGYRTAYIGKWHINGGAWDGFIAPDDRLGFEYWRGWECGHRYNDSYYWRHEDESRHRWEGYDAAAQTQAAIDYLQLQAGSGAPSLLFLSWGPPHNPYGTAPERFRSLYDPSGLHLRGNVPPECRQQARNALAGYYAHVSALDECMGRLLGALDDMGCAEDTIVVYTSDHGDMLYSHGQYTKQKPWDESILVPFLLRYPRRFGTRPRQLEMPLNTMDIMPTLLDLCGIPIPESVEGYSVVGSIDSPVHDLYPATLFSCIVPIGSWSKANGGREYRGVRTRRYTYVRDLDGPWLLYDTVLDPLQRHNQVHDPALEGVRATLDSWLMQELERLGDTFESGETYAERWGYSLVRWGYPDC